MPSNPVSISSSIRASLVLSNCKQIAAAVVLTLVAAASASAGETILHTFNVSDGAMPEGSLIFDAAGNLYGTTAVGGFYSYGTVFEMKPKAGGGWTETVLHSFNGNGIDGTNPYSALVFDNSGNLYGTTRAGGSDNVGTVFELKPTSSGTWKETVLHSFKNNQVDGSDVYGSLVLDSSGNLYGTTYRGGSYSNGTVFELTRGQNGQWKEIVLHNFNSSDGENPFAGLVFDASGNLYGTTVSGGAYGYGAAFELTPLGNGQWSESVIYSFPDLPYAPLIIDPAGNLYGVTSGNDGLLSLGSVFELSPQAGGGWTETLIADRFPIGVPFNGVVMDAAGNLYGTTDDIDGVGPGSVFELTRQQDGSWVEKALHYFSYKRPDGSHPSSSLLLDKANNIYGVTDQGGAHGTGVVFEIVP